MIEKGVWIAAVLVAAIAGWMDWRYRRIPNWLTVPGLLAGIVGNTLASGWSGAKASLLGAGLGLALLLPFVLVRSLGAGDWKLVGAVGALVGPGPLITVLVAAIFVAGIMAIVLIVYKRRVRQALRIVWFGRAFNIYATLNRAAREGALAAASPTCATCGNNFAQNTTDIQSVVDSTLRAAHLDPGQVQNFTLTQDVALNPGSNPVEYGSVVSLSYPWNFKLNGVTCCPLSLSPITTGITITAQAQAREER